MALDAFASASPLIQIHMLAASAAGLLGAAVLVARKGGRRHVLTGRIWVALMIVAAGSSFWIAQVRPGRFSPIHVLSVVSLVSIALGVYWRRRGRISGHRRAMIGAYLGLVGAALFTLAPGRLLNVMLFGP